MAFITLHQKRKQIQVTTQTMSISNISFCVDCSVIFLCISVSICKMSEHESPFSPFASPYEVNLVKMHTKSPVPLTEHSTAIRDEIRDAHRKHLPCRYSNNQNLANTHCSSLLPGCPANPSLLPGYSTSWECFMPSLTFSSVAKASLLSYSCQSRQCCLYHTPHGPRGLFLSLLCKLHCHPPNPTSLT